MGQQRGRKRSPSRADTSCTFRHFFRRRLFSFPSRFTLSSVRPTIRPPIRSSTLLRHFSGPLKHEVAPPSRHLILGVLCRDHSRSPRSTLSRAFTTDVATATHDDPSRPWVCEIFESIAHPPSKIHTVLFAQRCNFPALFSQINRLEMLEGVVCLYWTEEEVIKGKRETGNFAGYL